MKSTTTMSIALIVRKSIKENNFNLIPRNKLVEYQNILAECVMGCKKVSSFDSNEEGVRALNNLVNAAEVRKELNFHGDPMVEPYKPNRKTKKSSGRKRSGLLVSVDGSTPANMSKVRVSVFKAAKEIVLSQEPSPAQKQHLENMGVWDLAIVM